MLVLEPLGGMLAFGLAATGTFLIVVVANRGVPAPGATQLLQSSSKSLHHTVTGLGLDGKMLFLPDQGNVGEERVFFPAETGGAPTLASEAIVAGHPSGLAIPPLSHHLVREHERQSGNALRGMDLPGVEAFLSSLGQAQDLLQKVEIREGKGNIRVRFHAGAAKPACLQEKSCPPSGCALCHAAGQCLSRALERPMQLDQAVVDNRIQLEFKPL